MEKKAYEKRWVWVLACVVFLAIVQVLFTIKAPCKWLEAEWGAGDIISFVGTIVLGFIAVTQTQKANKVAESAHKASQDLIQLQRAEYIPLIEATGFAGISKYQVNNMKSINDSVLEIQEMRTEDNEVSVGYTFTLIADDTLELERPIYARNYELQFKYSGKYPIRNFVIKEIVFRDVHDVIKLFPVSSNLVMSLGREDDVKFFFMLVSNSDFRNCDNSCFRFLTSRHIDISMEITMFDECKYLETICITKHLVREPEKVFNLPDLEFPVSVSYDLQERTMVNVNG